MNPNLPVYDLGDAEEYAASASESTSSPGAVQAPQIRRTSRRPVARSFSHQAEDVGLRFNLPGTLSLFVPGSGRILVGEVAAGLFFLTSLAFLATLGWAVLTNMERLVPTLTLLGYSRAGGVWALGTLYGLAATVYLGNVISTRPPTFSRAPAPWLAGLASLLVPGWGQVLNGTRVRAGLFVGGLWLIGLAWLLPSPPAVQLFESLRLYLPQGLSILSSPVARWSLTAVVWVLAVYDAWHAAGASRQRTAAGF